MRRCALCAFLVFCTCALMGCVPVVLGGETVSTVRMTLVDWAGEEIAEPALAIPILRKSDGITVGFFTCQGDIPSGDPYTGRVFVQHSGGLTPIEEPPQKCVLWWPWSVFTSIGIPRAEGIIFVIPGRGCAFAPRCGLRGQSPDGQAIGSASFTRFDDRDGELACLGALLNEDLARSDELLRWRGVEKDVWWKSACSHGVRVRLSNDDRILVKRFVAESATNTQQNEASP